MKTIKALCIICKEEIENGGFDPCSLVIVAHSDQEWRNRKEQTFFCHMECFRKLVDDDSVLHIINADFPTNGEIEYGD